MTRRGFLGTLEAVAVAPFVPTPVTPPLAITAPRAFRLDALYGICTLRPELVERDVIIDVLPHATCPVVGYLTDGI